MSYEPQRSYNESTSQAIKFTLTLLANGARSRASARSLRPWQSCTTAREPAGQHDSTTSTTTADRKDESANQKRRSSIGHGGRNLGTVRVCVIVQHVRGRGVWSCAEVCSPSVWSRVLPCDVGRVSQRASLVTREFAEAQHSRADERAVRTRALEPSKRQAKPYIFSSVLCDVRYGSTSKYHLTRSPFLRPFHATPAQAATKPPPSTTSSTTSSTTNHISNHQAPAAI